MPRDFDRSVGGVLNLSELQFRPLSFPGWRSDRIAQFRNVNWMAFFADSGTPRAACQFVGASLTLSKHQPPLLPGLVQLVGMTYPVIRAREEAASDEALVSHLSAIKHKLHELGHLAQGGDGKGAPAEFPGWWRPELAVIGSGEPSELSLARRADPCLHPLIHEALVAAREEMLEKRGRPPNVHGDPRRDPSWKLVAEFFGWVQVMPVLIDRAIAMSRESPPEAHRGNRGHRSKDVALIWALSRLLWIWRDVIGKNITIHLAKTAGRGELETPEPNECMRFVIHAMAHFRPVQPHMLAWLKGRLDQARKHVPQTPLVGLGK